MSVDLRSEIQFLEFLRRGGDPDAAFQQAAAQQTATLVALKTKVMASLSAKQQSVVTQVRPLMSQLAASGKMQAEQEALNILEEQVTPLRETQQELEGMLQTSREIVQQRQGQLAVLSEQLRDLRKTSEIYQSLRREEPTLGELAILELGGRVSYFIGTK